MFKLESSYTPKGDQPTAIKELVSGLNEGSLAQTLLGVTGSGKTFTIANVIEQTQRPTLVLTSPITKHWLHSSMENSSNFFPIMQ